ncbi:MAG TPA: adenosylcobalamin-dependent ribonucleoside-diphosphate reductase [Ktedonosporobacter sp.]|nr:adenosylcobalamin-dependent ribonucleoside-diphosphate reductase [Ktedonosporobacter sp.]
MLEQQERPSSQDADSTMTQLEGIRQKVFMDRYSLKDAAGQPLEFYPEQTWARVARGIAAVETSEEKRAEWEKRFYDALSDFQFVPGGRILAGAGTGHQVTYYNCMPPDQEVLTANGYRPISQVAVGDLVVTHRNRLRPVLHRFERETSEPLYIIRPKKIGYDELRLTGEHKVYIIRSEWVNKHKSRDGLRLQHEPDWIPAKDIKPGDYVTFVYYDEDPPRVEASEHDIDLQYYFEHDNLRWVQIDEIAVKEYAGVVMDIEVEEDHSFISAGVVVSNCFVIPSPEDSRQGILDNLKLMTEIMARGGGVGINLSTLRPRGSYIKTVNGTASGPCSWAQLYSVATGDVIQQGGCFGPDERIVTDRGLIPAKELADRLDAGEAIQAQTHKGLRPFTSVFRNGIKDLYEVTTLHGYHVRVTLEHKMGVLRNGEIVTIPLRDLKEGNEILLLFGEGNKSEIHPDPISSITSVGASKVFDFEVDEVHLLSANGIYTSNSRRGALMLMLDDNHPDIEEFITVKRTPGKIEHANLSVCVSDAFMQAVKDDAGWNLTWQGEVKKTVRARALWDLICTSAWESAEPGVVFIDRYNKESNTWYYENIRCVNPCGEQGLPPFGVCNLGALNLAAFVKNGEMDWEQLAEKSKVAMRFLDNVVDANEYFIEENETAQLGTRRTGLGTMGLADALIKMKIAYGSEESLPVIERIYATIRDAAYEASADIAEEKGSFPHFDRDKYMQGKFIKRLPKHVQEKIRQQGIRNAVLLTQAPTGTTSLLAGVSSGIEPVYDFAMIRRDRTGEHILYHPLLQEWRDKHPNASTPAYFVSSKDLTPEEHVRVQAMVQRYTDSSISKTVNAPNEHTVEQVETLYRLAYEMGCKGVTYYRDGSRDAVLTRVEDEKKAAQQQAQETPVMQTVVSVQHGIKPRPPVVQGYTRQISAPEGKINVTINSDDQGPLEVFVNVGKAGSDIAALAEALGRLISLNLRVLSPLSQTDRLQEIAENLRGIGGSRSIGFGMQQVRSMPDAVARALELHLEPLQPAEDESAEANSHSNGYDDPPAHNDLSRLSVTGNLCPQCGCNTMVYEEGCRKCYTCGYSEC